MHCTPRGLRFIAAFEGGRSADGLFHAYWDPWGRVWTIGYGETSGVRPGMEWTLQKAEAELAQSLARSYEPAVRTLGNLNPNAFDAWCSIVWNLGTGAVSWDIGRLTRDGDLRGAAAALMQYDHAGGVRLAGLTRRRRAEGRLLTTRWRPTDPYALHPNRVIVVGGQRLNEHLLVLQTHGALAHPRTYHDYLKGVLRPRLKALRDRCKSLAFRHHPHAWADSRQLGRRWKALNGLMRAIDRI